MTYSGAARAALSVFALSACSWNASEVESYVDGGTPYYGHDSSSGAHDAAAWTGEVEPPPPEELPPEPDAGVDRCANRENMEPVVLYLSADDSNSMASPAIARAQLRNGAPLPHPSMLRTYEFLNYYNVRYPLPEPGHVMIVPELRARDAAGEYTFQIGVQAAPRQTEQARVITLVLDRSGSMGGLPIERERDVVRSIAHVLRPGDIVSWVEWNTERTVRLSGLVVDGPDDPRILTLVNALQADGGTDLESGLRFGYELAAMHYDPTRLNRVVLVSDGIANAGITSIDLIAQHSDDADQDGIYLVGVGVGDGVNDTLMDEVTDAGRGAYVFVDSAEEARVLFEDRFAETMDVGLLGVRVEVTLPWYMAIREFHGEEYSVGVPEAVRPQHLSPGDAMVFNQTIGACDPTLVNETDPVIVRATYTRPEGRQAAEDVVTTTIGALLAAPDVGLVRGDAIVAYAEALAALSRGDADAIAKRDLATARLQAALPANPDLSELVQVLDLTR